MELRRLTWESLFVFLTALLVLFFGTGNFWSATWLSKWALLLGLSSLALSIWAARRTSWWHFPLMLYASLNLLWLGVWTAHPYDAALDPIALLAVQKNALYGYIQWSIAVVFIASATRRWAVGAGLALTAIWGIGTIATVCLPSSGPHSAPNNGMWFGNPSMGASLLACLLPFAWSSPLRPTREGPFKVGVLVGMWLLTLYAIHLTGASVPWGVIGVTTAAWFASNHLKDAPWRVLFDIAALGIALLVFGYCVTPNFEGDSGRFEIWHMAYGWFKIHANHWTGFGYASSQVLLPIEQVITKHYYSNYWLWTHNDWLQLLVEGGWVGAGCVALSVGRLVRISWPHPVLFSSLVGFMAMAVFNYPLRMPIHCLCLALLCGLAEAYARSAGLLSPLRRQL